MQYTIESYIDIAKNIIEGQRPENSILRHLALTEDKDVFALMAGADLIRDSFFKREIHLCAICNGKSGMCSEDCKFCSQSKFHTSDIEIYPLMSKVELQKGAYKLMDTNVHRYSIVTTGKGLAENEVRQVADALGGLPSKKMSYCVSLGILDDANMAYLKGCGIGRYHHNLETCRSHFDAVCTSHTYDDRVNTIKKAKNAGLSVCSGGIFGVGESMAQVLELAFELRELQVDAVPINFLSSIPGTFFEGKNNLTPLKCLKIISIMRYVLPETDIIICGGRIPNLKMLHPFVFHAGANGIMTGNYLTTKGNQLQEDLEMINHLGFEPRGRTL
ncbi:biotin synthase BioB [Desulfobacter hydrogenophilus]|uniref:Biotin synthase n=1 Tax=Desulfobacter hydrogenophilus TaxID=2291 RepID=A0A328FI11_9BACT|nr:biotin synthase BioB [Desulfobacter hydrogenophilus]NDY71882.1 biotin synthase BioB [Desulfobacter hydrogenophilus]QBH11983.1 biotin synthase BioB [Desulfobacter hydrogenophilus]RAM02657.1 biotin synthase BioB [Desulfobacter hydrogenophilus]